MKIINQHSDQAVDVANWRRDEEFPEYPEGARDKTLIYPSFPLPFNFLKEDCRYLFKRSSHRCPEQFWIEIFAFRLGLEMEITVPPAFVAFDSAMKQCGALIEWFVNKNHADGDESYQPGGDFCQRYIPNFDRKKGTQHNFKTVSQIFEDLYHKYPDSFIDWKSYWTKAFVFDTLIGNTDRHQDNWGIILKQIRNANINETVRISPVFDNGTSMGWEILAAQFPLYESDDSIKKYIAKGWHHMKWSLKDNFQQGHFELLQKMAIKYPETRDIMKECIKSINGNTFKNILNDLVKFDIPVRLSTERSHFMLRLLTFRYEKLKNDFGC